MASVAGTIASTASLQLLIYAVVASGQPFPPPVWEPPPLFAAGGGWMLGLTLPGLFRDAASPERPAVAAAISAIADLADAIGTLTDSLDAAYDALLAGRIRTGGRSPSFRRFMGLLNAVTPLVESTVAAMRAGRAAQPDLAPRLRAVAAALLARRPLPPLPSSVGAGGAGGSRAEDAAHALHTYQHPSVRERLGWWLEEVLSGRTTRLFRIRLALCFGAAEIVRSQLHSSRSYGIRLTMAIVLKPDFGSVFARAVQRAVGTVVGAVLGAAILVGIPNGAG